MGLTMPEFRDKLATDLKVTIDTEVSQAEFNRCVERAVDDLSRAMPLEKVHEITLDFAVSEESITTPASASATAIVNAHNISAESDGVTLTIADLTPDVPRRLTVTLTDANYSVSALTLIVKGFDQDGFYIEESWYLTALRVSGTAYQGELYFSRITQVELESIAGASAADTISVGTGNAYDSYIYLTNKLLRPDTITVTSDPSGTTYSKDTDYTVDFANGGIKFINGGSMAAGTGYLVTYTKSKLGIDISSILPVVTRIHKVNYPVETVPQLFVSFNIIGDFMYIGSQKTGQSQMELQANKHLAIYYERKHHPPGTGSPGSYPGVLDEVIAIGAGGYVLLIEAMQFEQQTATDLTNLRTELGLTTAIHALVDTALGKVPLYLETNDTTDNAKDILANITDDIADLRTAIATAVDAANSYLDEVDTTDLGQATVGAEGLLETGDDLINKVNLGAEVAEQYANYSRARAAIGQVRTAAALGFAQEAQIRLSNLRSYIEEASGWNRIAEDFIAEAESRLGELRTHLEEAAQYQQLAGADMLLADRFRTEGTARLDEFRAILKDKTEYRKRVSSTPVHQPA